VVVIDPRMTAGCCSQCVAQSGAIALAQAISAMACESGSPMSTALAYPALSYLSQFLLKGVKRPKNKDVSVALANASVMASVAYANSQPGVMNLLARELARATDLAESTFLAALLPHSIDLMQKKRIDVSDDLLMAVAGMDSYAAVPAKERSIRGLEACRKLLAAFSGVLPASLQELKVQRYLFDEISGSVAGMCGKSFSHGECAMVLEKAWQGSK
jgi:alcohol dehydrogenase class IV